MSESGANPNVSLAEQRSLAQDWWKLTAAVACFSFGFNMYGGVFQNYIREQLAASVFDLGRLEALREVPGLLTSITAGILASLAESRIAALGLAICGLGIGLTTLPHAFWPLVGLTMFWSVGFHLYQSMQSALALNLAKGLESGRHLGRLGAVGGVATIVALGVSTAIVKLVPSTPYSVFFSVGGISIFVAAVYIALLSHRSGTKERQRIILRKEYGLYYFLIFLEGCRRQIFSIFASFTLIQAYGQSREQMLMLQFLNAILIAFTAGPMGKLIDRVGERKTLTWYAIGLILVFAGYAFVNNINVLYGLFILDNILFSFSIGFTTYLNRIVRPGELTPCVSMGVTMNHIAAVSVPILGSMLWMNSGNYHLPFILGSGIAVASLIATTFLPRGAARHDPLSEVAVIGAVHPDEIE